MLAVKSRANNWQKICNNYFAYKRIAKTSKFNNRQRQFHMM